jgi:hypothetical protein
MASLAGLTLFVTGASRGIGVAIAAKTVTTMFCAPMAPAISIITKKTPLLTSNPIYS